MGLLVCETQGCERVLARMSFFRLLACFACLGLLVSCKDDDPETICDVRKASAKLDDAADAVSCVVDGQTLTLSAKVASCSGVPLGCQHFPSEKAGQITFNVEARFCTTEGETTSGGCGGPQRLDCVGPLPAAGTYQLAGQGETPLSLTIGPDGTCVVK